MSARRAMHVPETDFKCCELGKCKSLTHKYIVALPYHYAAEKSAKDKTTTTAQLRHVDEMLDTRQQTGCHSNT